MPNEDEGGYVITSPDIPGLVTEGDNLSDAWYMAYDAAWGLLNKRPIIDFKLVDVDDA